MTRLPDAIREERVIPVARGLDSATAPAMVDALQAGGLTSIEITVEGVHGIEAISSVAGSGALVGAGTVVRIDQADKAITAGAVFLVSPHLDPKLIEWSISNSIPLIPGALTPTEVATAWAWGPPAVKIFPAGTVGPGYLTSLLGPYPGVPLIPTGGIDAGNALAYLEAGAVAVGIGGWLTGVDDPSEITRRASLLREAVTGTTVT